MAVTYRDLGMVGKYSFYTGIPRPASSAGTLIALAQSRLIAMTWLGGRSGLIKGLIK